MASSAQPLEWEIFQSVAAVLREWGALHPVPDAPVLAVAAGAEITPREIAAAMDNVLVSGAEVPVELPDTAKTLYMLFNVAMFGEPDLEFGEEPETLDNILQDFKRDIESWSSETLT